MTGLVRGPGQVAKRATVNYALSLGRRPAKFEAGGAVAGPLLGTEGGRTDTLPIKVPPGSYVIPADVVSGLPGAQGSSLAGHVALDKLLKSLPYSPDEAPYGATSPKLPRGHTIPGEMHAERHLFRGMPVSSKGGGVHANHKEEPVDILAAGGEHIIPAHMVKRIGMGDIDRGHKILDQFVLWARKKNIQDLKKLPGPVKS